MARRDTPEADAVLQYLTIAIRETLPTIATALHITPQRAAEYVLMRITEELFREEQS